MISEFFQIIGLSADRLNGNHDWQIVILSFVVVTFIILIVAIFASMYNKAVNQQQFEKVRQLSLIEIYASVLHNVANILNSVNVSASKIIEKNNSSHLSGLEKLQTLVNENKHDFVGFLKKDSNEKNVIEYINKLADYWRNENKIISEELAQLNKNIFLIKDIVNAQQDLSKTANQETSLSINELIDEALLISRITHTPDISIEKQYSEINLVRMDKTKLFQVFINIIINAKDALMESPNILKTLIIKTSATKKLIRIEMTDNGIGILPENINKIFSYGFTTKKSGHGFGLHMCNLVVKAMDGDIQVHSNGLKQGTTFIIVLPNKE